MKIFIYLIILVVYLYSFALLFLRLMSAASLYFPTGLNMKILSIAPWLISLLISLSFFKSIKKYINSKNYLGLFLQTIIVFSVGQVSFIVGLFSEKYWDKKLTDFKTKLQKEGYIIELKKAPHDKKYFISFLDKIELDVKEINQLYMTITKDGVISPNEIQDIKTTLEKNQEKIKEIIQAILESEFFSPWVDNYSKLELDEYYKNIPVYHKCFTISYLLLFDLIIKSANDQDYSLTLKSIFKLKDMLAKQYYYELKLASITIDEYLLKIILLLDKRKQNDIIEKNVYNIQKIIYLNRASQSLKNELTLYLNLSNISDENFKKIAGIEKVNRIKIAQILKELIDNEGKNYNEIKTMEDKLTAYPYFITKMIYPSLKGKIFMYEKNLKNLAKAILLKYELENFYKKNKSYPKYLSELNIKEIFFIDEISQELIKYKDKEICFNKYVFSNLNASIQEECITINRI